MRKKSKYSSVTDINVTSLVDVTMVLLIVFMLTAPFIQAGIELELPRVSSTVIKETEAVIIAINKDGEIFVNNEKAERDQLGDVIATMKTIGEDRVFVRADKDVPYGDVMFVIGEVKAAGIESVGMITDMKIDKK